MTSTDTNDAFTFDVRRCLILGAYMKCWGMPETRIVTRHPAEKDPVEVYSFPPRPDVPFHRFATVGVSAQAGANGTHLPFELMSVFPSGLCGASESDAVQFLLNVFAYGKRDDVSLRHGYVIPDAPVMPLAWKPRAVLIDEPLGEPEDLSCFHVGRQHVDLLWAAPIYPSEAELIDKEGIDALDAALREAGWSLAEPDRPPVGPQPGA